MARPVKHLVALLAALLLLAAAAVARPAAVPARAEAQADGGCPWVGSAAPVSEKTAQVVAAMTLDEKISMLGLANAQGYENVFPAIPRLCIPRLVLQDGPAGVAAGFTGVTQLPAPIGAAASWDPAVAAEYGQIQGTEAWGKGIEDVQGPDINIARVPENGRTFEAYGEDPYLAGQMAAADIGGIQRSGPMAMPKHFDANNQETNRTTINELISTRTLHEIYFPAFQAAVNAGAATAMCAYNQVNGEYSCQDPFLLTDVLENEFGFSGFIRSDLGASHDAAASFNAGMDQAKPAEAAAIAAGVEAGTIPESRINNAVSRILGEMFRFGLFGHQPAGNPATVVTSPAHAAAARGIAEDGTVLLKNSGGVLPLDTSTVKSIAVIGADGGAGAYTAGGGSSHVQAPYVITPYQGITQRAGSGVSVTYTAGSGSYADAAQAAKNADVAIVFANDTESEGSDRPGLSLPGGQDQLIDAVAQANPRTVVVLNTGSAVTMPWLDNVAGVVEAWYAGQEDGNAIASVLFGDVDPSGKLPLTFPASAAGTPAHTPQQWPGVNGTADYSEGLQVGYRWYDSQHIQPLFPFGYGLSYTTFSFSHLSVSPGSVTSLGTVQVAATVTNTGPRAGAEVAQLYVGDPPAAGEPPRQLKGFQKVSLAPGQSARVHFTLTGRDLSYWDSNAGAWAVPDGTYRIMVGDSSADLPLTGAVAVTGTTGARALSIHAPATMEAGKPATVTETLSAGGDLRLGSTALTLTAPAGWQVRALGPTRSGTVAPDQPVTAAWQVTAPAAAQDNESQLTAAAAYDGAGGTGSQTARAQVTVAPLVTTTIQPQSVLTAAGQAQHVTLRHTNTSGYPVSLTWNAAVPQGAATDVSPASGSATLAPGAGTSTVLTVTGSSPGTFTVPIAVQATAGQATLPTPGAYLQLMIPYPALAGAFGNVGITDDTNHAPGNFDGAGNSYSAQALAAAGITPGAGITARGIHFTWPDVPAGQPDNAVMQGQPIAMNSSGSTLGLLGAAVDGTHSGTGTVYYTDGSTQSFTITFPDWITTTAADGDDLIATTSYFNRTSPGPARTPSVFAAYAPLQAGKTIEAVQLPSQGDMHVFALAAG